MMYEDGQSLYLIVKSINSFDAKTLHDLQAVLRTHFTSNTSENSMILESIDMDYLEMREDDERNGDVLSLDRLLTTIQELSPEQAGMLDVVITFLLNDRNLSLTLQEVIKEIQTKSPIKESKLTRFNIPPLVLHRKPTGSKT